MVSLFKVESEMMRQHIVIGTFVYSSNCLYNQFAPLSTWFTSLCTTLFRNTAPYYFFEGGWGYFYFGNPPPGGGKISGNVFGVKNKVKEKRVMEKGEKTEKGEIEVERVK
jgi:hypothetical protein